MSLPLRQEVLATNGLNTPTISDISVSKGKATITGLGHDIPLSEVVSFTRTTYAAGTAHVFSIEVDGVTITDGKAYSFTLKKVIPGSSSPVVADSVNERTYTFHLADSSTVNDLRDALIDRINNDPAAFFTAAEVGGHCRVTVDSANYDVQLTNSPTGTTTANNTNYVEPNGTVTQLEEYAPGDSTSGATYTTYVIEFYKDKESNYLGNDKVGKKSRVIVFAKDDATGYADFDTVIQRVFGSTTGVDAAYEGSTLLERVAITGTDTLTAADRYINITGAGGYTLTLEAAEDYGERLLYVRNNATAAVTIQRAGSDTVNGGTSITIYADSGALLHSDGYSSWLTIIDSVDVS